MQKCRGEGGTYPSIFRGEFTGGVPPSETYSGEKMSLLQSHQEKRRRSLVVWKRGKRPGGCLEWGNEREKGKKALSEEKGLGEGGGVRGSLYLERSLVPKKKEGRRYLCVPRKLGIREQSRSVQLNIAVKLSPTYKNRLKNVPN